MATNSNLQIHGGYNATNAYGHANFAHQNSVPQLQWNNINPVKDYIETAMLQAKMDQDAEKLALLKDAHEYGKSRDLIEDAYKNKVFEANRDDEMFKRNGISAEKQKEFDLKIKEINSKSASTGTGSSNPNKDIAGLVYGIIEDNKRVNNTVFNNLPNSSKAQEIYKYGLEQDFWDSKSNITPDYILNIIGHTAAKQQENAKDQSSTKSGDTVNQNGSSPDISVL